MSRRRTKVDDFGAALQNILDDYGHTIAEKTKAAAVAAAKTAKRETQTGSPVLTGAYKKGWTVSEQAISRFGSEAVVHNRTDYQLTHLLEKGHAKQNGGRVAPIVHIEPAERHAIENFEKAVEKIAKEG